MLSATRTVATTHVDDPAVLERNLAWQNRLHTCCAHAGVRPGGLASAVTPGLCPGAPLWVLRLQLQLARQPHAAWAESARQLLREWFRGMLGADLPASVRAGLDRLGQQVAGDRQAVEQAFLEGLARAGWSSRARGFRPEDGCPVELQRGRRPGADSLPRPGDALQLRTPGSPLTGVSALVLMARGDGCRSGALWYLSARAGTVFAAWGRIVDAPGRPGSGCVAVLARYVLSALSGPRLAALAPAARRKLGLRRSRALPAPEPRAALRGGAPACCCAREMRGPAARPAAESLGSGDVPTVSAAGTAGPAVLRVGAHQAEPAAAPAAPAQAAADGATQPAAEMAQPAGEAAPAGGYPQTAGPDKTTETPHGTFLCFPDDYGQEGCPNRTMVFIPKGYSCQSRVDLWTHFHGLNKGRTLEVVAAGHKIDQIVRDGGRNVIFAMSRGDSNAHIGRNCEKGGYVAWTERILGFLTHHGPYKGKKPGLGRIIASGHSAGGFVGVTKLMGIGDRKAQIDKYLIFDGLYRDAQTCVDFVKNNPDKPVKSLGTTGGAPSFNSRRVSKACNGAKNWFHSDRLPGIRHGNVVYKLMPGELQSSGLPALAG